MFILLRTHVQGIYPTLIIILAALERHHSSSPFDKPTAPLGSLHFAHAPLPTRNPRHPGKESSIDNYTTTDTREREVQSVSRSHTLRSNSAVVPISDESMHVEGERLGDEWDIRLKEHQQGRIWLNLAISVYSVSRETRIDHLHLGVTSIEAS